MARSKRKTPIFGSSCSESNKTFKQHEHRRERRKARQTLLQAPKYPSRDSCTLEEYCKGIFKLHPKEFGNEWASPRDGKTYWGDPTKLNRISSLFLALGYTEESIIKEQFTEFKKLMRK